MISQIKTLQCQGVPIQRSCHAFALPRSSYYHQARPSARSATPTTGAAIPRPERALSADERQAIYALLTSERFMDMAPREIYAELLDQEIFLCSVSTMYRILHENAAVAERRNQRKHPPRIKPQLQTTQPNQLWSWDITKLRTPHKYVYFYLYVILDIFSRYVVGWMIAEQESADLAQQLISQSCTQQQVGRDQLTLHADRGAPMVALTTSQLLETLGVQKTHSRPYTPNDNAYSEAQFKTLKYRPDFPSEFATLEMSRRWARRFFHWYNHEHHHSGLSLLTPAMVHLGQSDAIIQKRTAVLQAAYTRHPERFVRGKPQHPALPKSVWINKPPTAEKKLENYSKFEQ